MPNYTTEQIRNLALVAHTGAGKTSLADALLFASGGATRQGRVDDGTSVSDFQPEEQKRGSSIQTSIVPCEWKGAKINLLDTPGYADFRGEMLSGLSVADAAAIVIAAPSGVEVGAEQAWTICSERKLPRLIVINKLDRDNTSFRTLVDGIAARWGKGCVPLQAAVGDGPSFKGVISLLSAEEPEGAPAGWHERLVEAVAETDDDLAVKYLEGEALTQEELVTGLRRAVASGDVVPIVAACAASGIGAQELLDAIVDLLPSPAAAAEREDAPPVPAGATAAFVFKTSADPFVGKLSYFRVYGAPVKSDSQYWNATRSENERFGQVYAPKGGEQTAVPVIMTGDIGVVAKLTATQSFDTISEKSNPVTLPGIDMPEPVYGLAVTPKTNADLDKMAGALSRLAEEDPSIRVERVPETKETVIRGLGDVHVETAVERIQRKFGVQLVTSLPRIPYRETITGTTRVEYKHKKQSGGHGQYGHVIMELSPLERGGGFNFSSRVVGGNVPKEYIPAVEKGVAKATEEGPLAGYPVVDIGVTLVDGSSHSVDSSGMAFEIAGSFALKNGVVNARPALLEPVMNLNVLVPDELTGDIIGDLNTKRARILGMTPQGQGLTLVEADVPLAMMQRYATDLRAITQSRGTFTARFGYYDQVPQNEVDRVVRQLSAKEAVPA